MWSRGRPASGISAAFGTGRPSVPWQMAQALARLRAPASCACAGNAAASAAASRKARLMRFPSWLFGKFITKCLRRVFAEAPAVLGGETPGVGELPARGRLAYASEPAGAQVLAHALQARIAHVAHGRNALEVAEVLQQRAPRHAGLAHQVGEGDVLAQM